MNVAWGDWDGDGDLDLAVGNASPDRLYDNTGAGLSQDSHDGAGTVTGTWTRLGVGPAGRQPAGM